MSDRARSVPGMALTPLEFPADDWLTWLNERGAGQLQAARESIAELVRAEPGNLRIVQLWNDAAIALRNAGSVAGLLSSVHPEAAVMERADEIERLLDRRPAVVGAAFAVMVWGTGVP